MCTVPQGDCRRREIQFLTDFLNQYRIGRPRWYWDSKVECEMDFDNIWIVGRLCILALMKGHIGGIKSSQKSKESPDLRTLILNILDKGFDSAYLLLCVSTAVITTKTLNTYKKCYVICKLYLQILFSCVTAFVITEGKSWSNAMVCSTNQRMVPVGVLV